MSCCMKTSSGFPMILHYGELYNSFSIYYNAIIIKCTINVVHLNHPKKPPPPSPPKTMENLSSLKLVPGAKQVGDSCFKGCSNKVHCRNLGNRETKPAPASLDHELTSFQNCEKIFLLVINYCLWCLLEQHQQTMTIF